MATLPSLPSLSKYPWMLEFTCCVSIYIMNKTIIQNDIYHNMSHMKLKIAVMLITQIKQVEEEMVLVHVLSDASILRQP